MSVIFYKGMRLAGGAVFRVASRPLILHRERAARPGAWLLAANHESPFDAALLIAATPRVIHWLSIAEIFRNPFARWFLTAMLASPLDRSRVDTLTVRTIVRKLRGGCVVGVFPEGGVRTGVESVIRGGGMKDGVAKLAELTGVPVVPCVVVGGAQFYRWTRWLPLFRTRWAVAFGEPIEPGPGGRPAMIAAIERAMRELHAEVLAHESTRHAC